MKARGKREAQRNASPLVTKKYLNRALKVRNTTSIIPLFQSFTAIARVYQGRRASRCSALAAGFHISRLWRFISDAPHVVRRLPLAFIFRAFGASLATRLTLFGACPWVLYFAPLALH